MTAPWTLAQQPRAWQAEALDAWRQNRRGIVAVVTGGGKTVFAQMCMLEFLQRHPQGVFVIIVPTQALLDQWYVSLRADLRVPEEQIAFFSGEGRPQSANRVNLMVLNTARDCAAGIGQSNACMLIVDECHRAASEANARALAGHTAAALGLSATPEREYDGLFESVLVPALGPVIFRYDYNQALGDGVIVPFDLVNVATEMTPEEQERYDAATRDIARTRQRHRAGNASDAALAGKLQRRARIAAGSLRRLPVAIRLAEAERRSRIIIFHETIEAAEALCRILQARRFNATLYHSRIDAVLRRDNLRLYRMGVFDTLVTCRALDEGVNVPETNVAIIAASTASARQRIQRLGRVLRPAIGKERAKVYTIYNTKAEENRLLQESRSLIGTGEISWMQAEVPGRDAATA